MPQSEMDPRLAQLVGELMAAMPGGGVPPEPPAPRPAPGQSREDWLTEVAAAREANDAVADVLAVHLTPDAPAVTDVRDHEIPVAGGTVTARVYTPDGPGPFPAAVFFHGGAWWLAGGEKGFGLTDHFCRIFCVGAGAVVVNVDYRLAPEFPFPQQPEDCFEALAWVVDHAGALVVDPDDVSVVGASSGGNQAAAVCLLARERGGPRIASQVLHVPALDLTGSSPSLQEVPGQWAALTKVVDLYADDATRLDPHVSPLLADDLSGLPPAVVVIGSFDSLRDDGSRYAQRLTAAGVEVRLLEFPMLHNIALPETSAQMFTAMVQAFADLRVTLTR